MAHIPLKIVSGPYAGKGGSMDTFRKRFYRQKWVGTAILGNFRDIAQVEIIADQTHQKSGVGRAVAGGVLLGGVGLVLGGLSGRKQNRMLTVGVALNDGTRITMQLDEAQYAALAKYAYSAKDNMPVTGNNRKAIKRVKSSNTSIQDKKAGSIAEKFKFALACFGVFCIAMLLIGIFTK